MSDYVLKAVALVTALALPLIADDDPVTRCPEAPATTQAACRDISYKELPDGARALLSKLKCRVSRNYDYGSAVDLNGDGAPEYLVCCGDAPHGPCPSVLIGKLGKEWRNLTAREGALGFFGACNGFVPLQTQHGGYYDLCLPMLCSAAVPLTAGSCPAAIWQFSANRYHSVAPTGSTHKQ